MKHMINNQQKIADKINELESVDSVDIHTNNNSKIVFKSISPAFEDEYEYTFNNLMQDIMDKYEFLVNGEKDRQEHIDLVNKLANIYRIDNKRR